MNAEPSPDPEPDESLAARAAAGDDDAFGRLAARYQVPLLRFLMRFAPRRHDAEDLLQETFVRLYASRAAYVPRWRYRTWAFTVARRTAIDAHRRSMRAVPTRSDSGEPVARSEVDADEDVGGEGPLWSLARRTLSGEQVQALWLFHVQGVPPREIARVLGRSWVSVKTMLHRARRRLHAAATADARRDERIVEPIRGVQ